MKNKIFYLSLIFFLNIETMFGQILPAICPSNPVNGTGIDHQVTHFQCYINGNPGVTSIESPFHAVSIVNPNIYSFYANSIKDYKIEDGWTYLTHNFGSQLQYIDQPYLILYNKFSGVLRVFIALTRPFDQNNKALLHLSFLNENPNKRTSILENLSPDLFRKPLRTFNTNFIPGAIANPHFSNFVPYWTFADFSLNYDPCTCFSRSTLLIKLIIEKKENLQLTLNGSIVSEPNIEQMAGTRPNFSSVGKDIAPKIGDLLKGISATSDAIKGLNSTASTGNTTNSSQLSKFLKPIIDVANAISPGVSAIINFSTFVVGLFKKSEPVKPVTITYKAKLDGEGAITWASTYQIAIVKNPGASNEGVSPLAKPYYDNILGTFTLLETPVFNVEHALNIIDGENNDKSGYSYRCGGSDKFKTRISLKNDLKYSINPSSQLSIVHLNANYIYQGVFVEGTIPFGCLKQYKPIVEDYGKYYDCFPDRGTQEFEYGNYIADSGQSGIKITAIFAAPNGQEYVYTNIYEAQLSVIETNFDETKAFDDVQTILPPEGCSTINPPATTEELLAICSSKDYQDRVQSFKDQEDHLIQKRTEKTNFGDLIVFPNPTSGLVTLQLPPSNSIQKSIKIFNTSGKLEREFKSMEVVPFNGSEHRLFLDLPQGIYIIQCEYEDHILTSRISIQK
jgi:hypothetical protein